MKVSIGDFLQNSNNGTWEFDDILYINFQQSIPADIFAIGIVMVETFVGDKIKASGLRVFSNRCKRMIVGGRTPDELMTEHDFLKIYEAFKKLGLVDMFALVLKCVLRGDKSLGYYCANHSNNSAAATVRLLQDYSQIMNQYSALKINNVLENKLSALSQQLDEYKNVFGNNADRSEIFKEVGTTKEHLQKLEQDFKDKSDDFAELTKVLQNTEKTLQQSLSGQKHLRSEKTDIVKQHEIDIKKSENTKNTLTEELNQRIKMLEEEKAKLTTTQDHLKNSLGEFIDEYGSHFNKTVKAWGSRKKAAAMVQDFRDTLFAEKS